VVKWEFDAEAVPHELALKVDADLAS
jgi:hypothetical protein